jgi:hypothetical protein
MAPGIAHGSCRHRFGRDQRPLHATAASADRRSGCARNGGSRSIASTSLHEADQYGRLAPSVSGPRPMRWFRSNGGGVAWLAIFALACQFVFTFGHIHSGRGVSAALAISADGSDGSVGAPPSPVPKVPTGLAQDFCAVCNHIGLANALVLPVSPATVPPISFIRELQWPLVAIAFASRNHFHFNARGPPHA